MKHLLGDMMAAIGALMVPNVRELSGPYESVLPCVGYAPGWMSSA